MINNKCKIEAFIEESEKIRKTPISQDAIARINIAAHEAESEEMENEKY